MLGWQLQVRGSTDSALESWQKADSTRDVQVRHATRMLTMHFAKVSVGRLGMLQATIWVHLSGSWECWWRCFVR